MSQYQSFPDAAGDSRTLDKLKALRLPDLAGKRFLDVGCNEGFFCGFARFQGARRVVGLDSSEAFVARARQRFPDCEFHCRDWERLPEEAFDVVLLASALHYAQDQPALIHALVERLSDDGVLVLELGIASSRKAEWTRVDRGADQRLFPSMPMLKEVLAEYAWKWMGPSIAQDGDPVPRHVLHIHRRRPVAYLLMQPPGYGKSSIAARLFAPAGVRAISGDQQIAAFARAASDGSPLAALARAEYSPYRIDRFIERAFAEGCGAALIDLWLAPAAGGDVALDVYVPAAHHETVCELLQARGYLPVRMSWERSGAAPLPERTLAERAEAFYLSLQDAAAPGAAGAAWEPAGFVDDVRLEEDGLWIRGWAVDAAGRLPERIRVRLGRRTLAVGTVERQLRPDVQKHLGLPHALVGYRLRVDAPWPVSARDLERKGLRVSAPGGPVFALAGSPEQVFAPGPLSGAG